MMETRRNGAREPQILEWNLDALISRRTELALVILLLAIALGLRLWDLGGIPAGLSHDEAYDGLNAIDIMQGARPLFFESNNGREALFMYLVAGSFSAFGVGAFALRLVSVLASVLALATGYTLVRRAAGKGIALAALAFGATSFWTIFTSRLGLRASLMPLAVAVISYGLWRSYEAATARGRIGWAAVAGATLGLGFYTYTPARFLPAIPVLFVVYLIATGRVKMRSGATMLGSVAAAAALVSAPIARYFLQHPDAFAGRSAQVNDLRFIIADFNFLPLIEDTINTLGMFSLRGDPSWRYNLAGRPLFDVLSAAVFYLGLAIVLALALGAGSRRGASRWNRAVLALKAWGTPDRAPDAPAFAAIALITLGVTLLPSASTGESPHFLRAIGAQAIVYVLPAVGIMALGRALVGRFEGAGRLSAWVLLVAVLAVHGGLSAADYFGRWNQNPTARFIYGGQHAGTQQVLSASPNRTVLVGAEYPADIDRFVLDLLRGNSAAPVTWFDSRKSIVISTDPAAMYVIPVGVAPPADLTERFFPNRSPGPSADVWIASPPAEASVAPEHKLSARIDRYLELVGYDEPAATEPGAVARIIMYWKILERPSRDISLYAHLIGANGSRWAQDDSLAYPIDQWQPGQMLIQWHEISVPLGAPPVDYRVEAGAYFRDGGERLPVVIASAATDRLVLDPLRVERPRNQLVPRMSNPAAVPFGDAVALAGFDLPITWAHPGDQLNLTLFWRASSAPPSDYTVFVHLAKLDAQPIAQNDSPPAYGGLGTSKWQPGDVIRDEHDLIIPPDASPGRYWLLAGLYDPKDGSRLLPTVDAEPGPLDRLGRWLEGRTGFRAGTRADGNRVILTAFDVRPR